MIAQSAIRTVNPGGSIATVATAADGLDWASSIAFGTSHGEHGSLYAVNFAIGPPGEPAAPAEAGRRRQGAAGAVGRLREGTERGEVVLLGSHSPAAALARTCSAEVAPAMTDPDARLRSG